ncbi:hypothetical protein D3C71_1420320 [compost metagenome]
MHAGEVFQQLIQLVLGRPPVALTAFHVVAQLSQYLSSVSHRMGIDLISPRRACNRKDSSEMRKVVASRLWLNTPALIAHSPERKVHQPLTVDI